jgi:hypothetical protein
MPLLEEKSMMINGRIVLIGSAHQDCRGGFRNRVQKSYDELIEYDSELLFVASEAKVKARHGSFAIDQWPCGS